MIKNIVFRIIRSRIKSTLPLINKSLYKKMFTLTYKFFVYLKPSQIWVIILALLNKTDLKGLLGIPSLFILFNNIFSDSNENLSNVKVLYTKLEGTKLTDSENKLENFFWLLIILAIIKRFITTIFKFFWVPFKVALLYFTLKHFGFNFEYAYSIINTISLGIIDWFYIKFTNFLNYIYPNDSNNF